MKSMRFLSIALLGLAFLASNVTAKESKKPSMATQTPAGINAPTEVQTRLGTLKTIDGFPDEATIEKVYNMWFFFRGFLENGSPAPAVASIKKNLHVYPLAKAANPPQMNFVNMSGKYLNTIGSIDFSFFEDVNEVVQDEPTAAMDPDNLGLLASIGIVKGKPFKPDARMKKILTRCPGRTG